MNAISGWIMSILGIVVVGTLIDLILPSGRMNKFIKSIFATVTVLVIILPLPSLLKNNFNIKNDALFNSDFTLNESYLSFADDLKLKYLAKGVESKLADDGFKNVKIEISGSFENNSPKVELVHINLAKLVIEENKQHINKYEQIRELVSGYLAIEKGVIIINE